MNIFNFPIADLPRRQKKTDWLGITPYAFEAIAADLDNDGQIEVVASAWDRQLLKDGWIRADQVLVADLNGDGRPDIVAAAERGSNELVWWRNEGKA